MDEYTFVEEILDKKVFEADGRIEYYVKWKSFCGLENSWVLRKELDCPKLLKEFERNRLQTRRANKMRRELCNFRKQNRVHLVPVKFCPTNSNEGTSTGLQCQNTDERVPKTTGFARGLEPECIVGAKRCMGRELFVLTQWKDSDLIDIVPAREARAKCPQILLDYYEKIIRWKE